MAWLPLGVLDEGDDELMNVNIQDIERVEKNIENKKKKPTYNPYEVEEDEFGMVSSKTFYLFSKMISFKSELQWNLLYHIDRY